MGADLRPEGGQPTGLEDDERGHEPAEQHVLQRERIQLELRGHGQRAQRHAHQLWQQDYERGAGDRAGNMRAAADEHHGEVLHCEKEGVAIGGDKVLVVRAERTREAGQRGADDKRQ